MDNPEYDKLLTLLDSAKHVLSANAGSLTPADLRIRCLVNITGKEAQRAQLEMLAATRSPMRRQIVDDTQESTATGQLSTRQTVSTH